MRKVTRFGPRTRIPWTAFVVAIATVAGCSQPDPLVPPVQGEVVLTGRVIAWTSSRPGLARVRYGRRSGVYDAVAYPPAAGREDRRAATTHRVPLLSAIAGDTLYVQAVDIGTTGIATAGREVRVVLAGVPATPSLLRWTMIDVGFGDSHLLEMPGTGRRILVDAGERRDAANVAAFLAAAGIGRLDAALATHIHADHIGGLVGEYGGSAAGILETFDIGVFLDGPDHSGERGAYDELLATLAAHSIPRRVVEVGDTEDDSALAWDPTVRVEVLNAGRGHAIGGDTESDWINNDSVVLRLGYGDVDLLLGGDAESPVQSRLAASAHALDAEVLKVHHHGVADASEPAYLAEVNPRVGLIPISADESFSGSLPAGIVLDRLRQLGVDVYASDRADALGLLPVPAIGYHVTLVTDGTSYEIRVRRSASRHYPPDDGAAARAGGIEP